LGFEIIAILSEKKLNIIVKLLLLVPAQFINEFLMKYSFSMMFIILTNDNQSTL